MGCHLSSNGDETRDVYQDYEDRIIFKIDWIYVSTHIHSIRCGEADERICMKYDSIYFITLKDIM